MPQHTPWKLVQTRQGQFNINTIYDAEGKSVGRIHSYEKGSIIVEAVNRDKLFHDMANLLCAALADWDQCGFSSEGMKSGWVEKARAVLSKARQSSSQLITGEAS